MHAQIKRRERIDIFLERKGLQIIESGGRQDSIYYVVYLGTGIKRPSDRESGEYIDIFVGKKQIYGRFRTLYQIENHFRIK